jgi:1-acyl-sn-glycerol-3-phosphate acyltransferase
MIIYVRALIRLILFFVISLSTVVLVALGNLVLGIFSKRWAVRWKNTVIRSWALGMVWLLGIKINVKGTPPNSPFFMVCNHLSYIDVVPLWLHVDATFIAKSEIKSWPFFGWGTRTLGVLFIDRELKRDVHRMNKRISDTISDDQGVILFPEGTSTKGEQVVPFNAPLLKYPVTSQTPVHYATISYRSQYEEWPAHLNICWWDDMPFLNHFWDLLKIPEFEVDITFGDSGVFASDRKELADKLHTAVSDNFTPVVSDDEPKVSSDS